MENETNIYEEHSYTCISKKKYPGQIKNNNKKRVKLSVPAAAAAASAEELRSTNTENTEDSFFKKHFAILIRNASKEMETIDTTYLSENMKNSVIEIIGNPDKVYFNDDLFKHLEILENKKVNDQGTFATEVAKLVRRENFSNAMEASFSQLTQFSLLDEQEKYQLTQCFSRRFFNEAKIKLVEIASKAFTAAKPNTETVRPYPLMTIKESLDKEEKVIHHIGGYIAHQLILKYGYSASHFVKNALKLDSGEIEDYGKWTQELSNGGLLFLKQKSFLLFKKINDLSKVYYGKKNDIEGERVTQALTHLKNHPFIKNTFFDLWGEDERKDAALKMGCKIYLNCLGKGFINKRKTEIQIIKRASLKTVSLRKEMKNQKACKKCHDIDSETKKTPKLKVTKTRKPRKGFLA